VQNKDILIKYLYHELSEKEAAAIQTRLLLEDELFSQLEALEMDLIDGFVLNKMNSSERQRFIEGFLPSSANQGKVQQAQALHAALATVRKNQRKPGPRPIRKFTGSTLALRLAFYSLLVFFFVAIPVYYLKEHRASKVPEPPQVKASPISIPATVTPTPTLVTWGGSPPPRKTVSNPKSMLKVRFGDKPPHNMSGTNQPKVVKFGGEKTIRFSFPIEKGDSKSYLVTIACLTCTAPPIQSKTVTDGSEAYMDLPSAGFEQEVIYKFSIANIGGDFEFLLSPLGTNFNEKTLDPYLLSRRAIIRSRHLNDSKQHKQASQSKRRPRL